MLHERQFLSDRGSVLSLYPFKATIRTDLPPAIGQHISIRGYLCRKDYAFHAKQALDSFRHVFSVYDLMLFRTLSSIA